MTLSKASLGEALAHKIEGPKAITWADGRLIDAARFVERLLPATCENCEGTGSARSPLLNSGLPECAACHGTGQLWDEGLVEAVQKATLPAIGPLSASGAARAVLAALADEVGK